MNPGDLIQPLSAEIARVLREELSSSATAAAIAASAAACAAATAQNSSLHGQTTRNLAENLPQIGSAQISTAVNEERPWSYGSGPLVENLKSVLVGLLRVREDIADLHLALDRVRSVCPQPSPAIQLQSFPSPPVGIIEPTVVNSSRELDGAKKSFLLNSSSVPAGEDMLLQRGDLREMLLQEFREISMSQEAQLSRSRQEIFGESDSGLSPTNSISGVRNPVVSTACTGRIVSGGSRIFQSPRSRPLDPQDELVLQHQASRISAPSKAHEQQVVLPTRFTPEQWASAGSAGCPGLLEQPSSLHFESSPQAGGRESSDFQVLRCNDPCSVPVDGDGDIDSRIRCSAAEHRVDSAQFVGNSDLENTDRFRSTAVPESSPAGQSDIVRVVKPVRSALPLSQPAVKVVKATRQT